MKTETFTVGPYNSLSLGAAIDTLCKEARLQWGIRGKDTLVLRYEDGHSDELGVVFVNWSRLATATNAE